MKRRNGPSTRTYSREGNIFINNLDEQSTSPMPIRFRKCLLLQVGDHHCLRNVLQISDFAQVEADPYQGLGPFFNTLELGTCIHNAISVN